MPLLRELLLAGLLAAAAPQEREAPEYEIKAAFLYNFATFVEWPSSAFPEKDSPFTVGVMGKDPFGTGLEEAFQGKTVNGRRIVVRRGADLKDLGACQLLFVSGSEADRAPKILESLKGRPTLTVGDMGGFAAMGGCINFTIEGPKIRFEINPGVAKRSGLTVSSKLLRLARIVGEK